MPPWTWKVLCLLAMVGLASTLNNRKGLSDLRITGAVYPNFWEDVVLTLHYSMKGTPLRSVKWFKGFPDKVEFFRYTPGANPQVQVFPQPGVDVDVSRSGADTVVLRNVSARSSERYTCQLETETLSAEASHDVYVTWQSELQPQLHGLQKAYSVGDLLTAHCSAPASYPGSFMVFQVNGNMVESVTERPPATMHENGTYSASATLRLQVEEQHFRPPEGLMDFQCWVYTYPFKINILKEKIGRIASNNGTEVQPIPEAEAV